jgi:hypothetical protein
MTSDDFTGKVRGHDEDGVFTLDHFTFTIRQTTLKIDPN